ncbi:CAP domain-containing protein [Galbibacter pacificus]|uniref:CAP domain-containing protein n=1 Tax=Galbibacter pacificus TaxID=2996052 RepID=A0ABT6FTV4_9FLAO|nr:CAP domain-containing protein [Galbibacter pacificus]MDG3583194.1 CAP domain-containing protein [Galbibacter pacificus]MDG3586675.1 CAP domain-containing protein [Galbibacter pacificus]
MKKYIFAICIVMLSCSNEEVGELEQEYVTANTNPELEAAVIDEVNKYRNKEGLNSLEYDASIYKYAAEQTQYMVSTGNINHNNFEGRATLLSKSTQAEAVSENVAKNYPDAQSVVSGWISSKGHHKNIIGNYTHTAVSVAKDAKGTLYYTQIFYKSPSK